MNTRASSAQATSSPTHRPERATHLNGSTLSSSQSTTLPQSLNFKGLRMKAASKRRRTKTQESSLPSFAESKFSLKRGPGPLSKLQESLPLKVRRLFFTGFSTKASYAIYLETLVNGTSRQSRPWAMPPSTGTPPRGAMPTFANRITSPA